jgi:lambda repressor-like predicted transcriptional regulator
LLLHPTPKDARGTDAHLARVHARAAAAERAQAALRDAVTKAAAAGLSLRKLGRAAGLSHERIRVMLADEHSSS